VTELLDVNVLVSLAWPNHVHHGPAQAWFRGRGSRAWATTPITECGFVRVSSNRSAIPEAVSVREALSLLSRMRTLRGHVFLPDDVGLVVGDEGTPGAARLVSHRAVTDAHLVALARRHGAKLVTFDRGIEALVDGDDETVVLVSTARA
jgi:toxin-antitoxin system PIN domain toxin